MRDLEFSKAKLEFERLFGVYNSGKIGRLRHGHIKLIYSKILEYFSWKTQRTFRRRVQLPWGEKINVVCPDTTSLDISRFGFYEEGLTRAILDYLKPGMTFLDVGANVGYYTLMAAWLVGDNGSVHSFEPTPETFNILQSNAEQKQNVQLNKFALSYESGTIRFNDYGAHLMGRNSKFQQNLDAKKKQNMEPVSYEVPATTIDEYVTQNDVCPNFIKIDTEHSEYDIIQGMHDTLNSYHPVISIEVGDSDIEGVPPCKEIIEFMTGEGYQAYEFRNNEFVEHLIKDRYEYDNLVFKPKG